MVIFIKKKLCKSIIIDQFSLLQIKTMQLHYIDFFFRFFEMRKKLLI